VNLVLFGPPGAGKGTQAQRICEKYHLTHLSTGDAIRAAIRAGNAFGEKVRETVERGELIPDDMVTDLVIEFVKEKRPQTDSFLFDGFPRTTAQIGALDGICERFNLTPAAVVNLEVPESILMLRITGRRICLECKKTFNIYLNHPPKESGCDIMVCPLLQRADDKPETVRERLRVYHAQTEPVLHDYEMRGNLATINGTGDTEDVFERICTILAEHY